MSQAPADLPGAFEHRRQTTRKVRHQARTRLHTLAWDTDLLEDADVACPEGPHDIGRHASPPARSAPKPGRRAGFKVWKTPFWKRRRALWAERNRAERRLADLE